MREPRVTAVPVAFMRSPCAQSKAEGPPAVNRLECTAVRLCSFSRCSSDSSVYMRAAEVNSVSPPLASGERQSSAVCDGPTLSCGQERLLFCEQLQVGKSVTDFTVCHS